MNKKMLAIAGVTVVLTGCIIPEQGVQIVRETLSDPDKAAMTKQAVDAALLAAGSAAGMPWLGPVLSTVGSVVLAALGAHRMLGKGIKAVRPYGGEEPKA